jgi:predicted kinase
MRFTGFLFVTGALLGASAAVAARRCPPALSGYERGAVTDRGRSLAEYFREATEGDRPRMVLLQGLPGSGKSTWTSEAAALGWEVISLDDWRRRVIERRLAEGKPVKVKGKLVIPNPLDNRHLVAVTWEAGQNAQRQFVAAMAERRPVLWDGVYDMPRFRVPTLTEARTAGYFTECLSFVSPDLRINLANVALRVAGGGRDIAAAELTAKEKEAARIALLTTMQERLRTLPLREDATAFTVVGALPESFDRIAARGFIAENDFVNRLERVRVQNWSKAKTSSGR